MSNPTFPQDGTTDSPAAGRGATLGESTGFTLGGPAGATFGERNWFNLQPAADGDLVRRVRVGRTRAVRVGATTRNGTTFDVTVRWVASTDPDAAVFATDTSASGVSETEATVPRKGPVAEVTLSSAEAATTPVPVVAYIDTTE